MNEQPDKELAPILCIDQHRDRHVFVKACYPTFSYWWCPICKHRIPKSMRSLVAPLEGAKP